MMLPVKNRGFILSLLVASAVLMNAARYILKFGAASSSPGYSDTPFWFWILRYLLVAAIFFLFLMDWKRFQPIAWTGFGLLAISSAYAVNTANSHLVQIAAFHFCLAAALFAIVRSADIDTTVSYVSHLTKALIILAISAVVFLILQFFLYFVFDVLPSHSHKNTILIRFGSILDDSLAFGILLPMFAGLCFYGLKDDFVKSTTLVCTITIAVLTGSLTAMATTALYTIWLLRGRLVLLLAWGLMLALLLFAFRWYFHELFSAKSGSIAGHIGSVSILAGDQGAKIESGGFAESGWVLIIKNFGVPAFFLMLGLHTYVYFLCRRFLKAISHDKKFVGATDGLNFSALVSSINLPAIMIFPVYLLLALFSAILLNMADKSNSENM